MPRTISFPLAGLLLCSCIYSGAQTQPMSSPSSLPDAPAVASPYTVANADGLADLGNESSSNTATDSPQQSTAPSTPAQDGQPATQTKRILGVIPNFRAVSANTKLPPQSPKEKFLTATEDSFDYSSLLLPAFLAGYSQATNATPEFHQGAAGYARYYWHSYVDQAVENYSVEAIGPIITHQDNRYYTMGSGGFLKRSGYALTRAVITRNDAGNNTFNSSEVIGAGAAAGISNLYYPSGERTLSNTVSKWGLNVGIDAGTFLFKEFWPDINNALFHTKD
jgi:hypothetical protein